MNSGDAAAVSQRQRRRRSSTKIMVPERDTKETDAEPSLKGSFLRPRLPKLTGALEDTSASASAVTTPEILVTNTSPTNPSPPSIEAGTESHGNVKSSCLSSKEPSSASSRSRSKKKSKSRDPASRIPADTPERGPTSSEDDSLRSAESHEKEPPPPDEYLTITMNSTPEGKKIDDRSPIGTKAKLSFLNKWTKKVTESFRSSSVEKGDLDEEKLVEGESEVIQLETLSLKEEDEVRKPEPKGKKKRSEIRLPIGQSSLPPVPILSPSSKRNLRRREKAGEFRPDDKLLGIKIHHTDLLPTDPNILHPVVRLTIMDLEGNFLVKTTQHRKSKESSQLKLPAAEVKQKKNYVEQVITQPSHVDGSRFLRLLPRWEEMFVITEPLERFLVPDPPTILFFEIMDFLPMDHQSLRGLKSKVDLGWHKIAWAFLRPLGADGKTHHVNRKLRLQLYRPEFGKGAHVHSWWKSKKWTKLNSTLYVTLKGILPPEYRSPESTLSTLRNIPKEELAEALIEGQLARGQKSRSKDVEALRNKKKVRKPPEWRRLPMQSCKVPNKLLLSLPASDMDWLNFRVIGNVQCVKFSPCGMLLAAGLDTEKYHVVLIFEIPSGKLLKNLRGHHGIIYELDWRKVSTPANFYALASASADSTVRVWELDWEETEVRVIPLCVLLHPSYVYTVEFSPTVPTVLATGCFDSVIRIWEIPSVTINGNQPTEQSAPLFLLNRHQSYVNAVRFNSSGERLFSGDGKGMLCEWVVAKNGRQPPKLEKETKLSSNGQVSITSLCLDGNGRKILVQLRQSVLKILDVESFLVLNTFKGLSNERLRLQSVLSPCGNLVLSGSEEAALYVWDADTGRLLSEVRPANHPNSVVSSVAYHPFDHYVAVGLLSPANEPHPILLYTFEYPANLSIGTISKIRSVFRESRSKENSGSGDAPSLVSENQSKGSDVSEKFRSIIQKLDEVTGGTPLLAQVATSLIQSGPPPGQYSNY